MSNKKSYEIHTLYEALSYKRNRQKGLIMTLPKNRIATHPGVILRDQFLKPLGIKQKDFAAHLDISVQRLSEIINGKRSITAETAWLLAGAFSIEPQFWMRIQMAHDLTKARPKKVVPPLAKNGELIPQEDIIV